MSKLYEALLQAKQDKKTTQDPAAAPRVEATAAFGLDTEMLVLYRSLENVLHGLGQKVILFLGAKGGEGTSTVVSTLARIAAERLNRKVAILDADTLNPAQHRLFGVSPTVGWDDVLRGTVPAEKVFYPTTDDRLWVVPVSAARAGTVQVVDVSGIESLFMALRERVDLILIDCAPATAISDTITLSGKADGVVLVVEAESTRWPVTEAIHQQITNAGGQVIGIVFNKRRYYIPEFLYRRL